MARGRAILRPGTYGKVCVRPTGHGTYNAGAWARLPDNSRREYGRNGNTPEEAEHRLREALHSIGLRDARNGAVSVQESATEGQDQHEPEHVQGEAFRFGDLDTAAPYALTKVQADAIRDEAWQIVRAELVQREADRMRKAVGA